MPNNPQSNRPQVAVMPGIVGILMSLTMLAMAIYFPFMIEGTVGYSGTRSVFNGDILDWLAVPMGITSMIMLGGLKVLNPNEAVVLVFFGKFKGMLMENGFYWVNPLTSAQKVSLKIENYESQTVKVNDKSGSPIMVGAVVSCQVTDPEAYAFNAEDPKALIMNAIDRVLRKTVSRYPYDSPSESDAACLRDDSAQVSKEFEKELQSIVGEIGVKVLDANFSNMSYAPEIAAVMLQRQQAEALNQARKIIIEGSVTLAKDAIATMERGGVDTQAIKLSETQKGQLASNLLVVLVSDRGAQVTVPLS